MPDALKHRVGPQPGGPLYVPDTRNNREGPQAREPPSAAMGGAEEKDWPKRPSDRQLQEAQKKGSDRVLTPAVEASVSLHTWRRQGPHKPSSCATFTLNPHGGRAAPGKKVLRLCMTLYVQGHFSSV